ncbi:MAG: hypothetical protein J6Q61_06575 [Bacteroidales bacterium]|nr:hypothetical protein [Bacteroidales bacterium]
MANPLFATMGNQVNPFADIIRQAQELKQSFPGNPRDEVQRLLNSGAMSQSQFNEYSQIAQQVVQFMGKK